MVASNGNNLTRRDNKPLVNKKPRINENKMSGPRNNSNAIFNSNQINDQLMDPGYMDFNIPARPIIKSSMPFKKNRQPPSHIRLPPQIMNNQRPLLPPPFRHIPPMPPRRMRPPTMGPPPIPMRSMPPPPINGRFHGPRHNMPPPPPPMLRPHPIMAMPQHAPMGPPRFLMGPMGPRNVAGHPMRRNKNNRRNNRSKQNLSNNGGGGGGNNRNRRIQINKYDINKPWVTVEIREVFDKKVELENKLKGNKNDQLFAEFKIQRDKFVKMYEASHLEFIGKHDKKVIIFSLLFFKNIFNI